MSRLVEHGKVAGLQTMVARRGRTVWFRSCGMADLARAKAMEPDTIVLIYSMTKPLTSVAVMMLYEQGWFQLNDPITRFLPYFANMRVFTGGSRGNWDSVPTVGDITFRDLLTHTSASSTASWNRRWSMPCTAIAGSTSRHPRRALANS